MSFVVTRDDWIRLVQRTDALEATAGSVIDDDVVVPEDINNIFGVRTALDSDGNALIKTSVYLATSDGFISVSGIANITVAAYTDSSNPPTTKVINSPAGGVDSSGGFSFLARQNDYWKVTGTTSSIFWVPVGDDGECEKQ